MTTKTKHPLVELLENTGGDFEMREYSGRGMYGDKCLGLVGSIGRIVGDIVEACLSEDIPTESREYIADAVRGMRTDSMGRDSVVYFPSVAYAEDEDLDGILCAHCGVNHATLTVDDLELCGPCAEVDRRWKREATKAEARRCDFDECPRDATERRGALQLCGDHARGHDRLVAEEVEEVCSCCPSPATTLHDAKPMCEPCAATIRGEVRS